MGYESKRGKYVSVKGKGQKKFLRFRSLGAGYREQDLERIFSGETREKVATDEEKTEPKLDMLLDIQKMIAKGKGPGYERWAKVHNIKQMAQTLLFLEEHNLRDYDELAAKAKSVSDRFAEITERQKSLEARLTEITDLKKHIINYSKTKQIYVAYRESGYSKKFFEEHREEITLHKAAKEAFSKIKGKIPTIESLTEFIKMQAFDSRAKIPETMIDAFVDRIVFDKGVFSWYLNPKLGNETFNVDTTDWKKNMLKAQKKRYSLIPAQAAIAESRQ